MFLVSVMKTKIVDKDKWKCMGIDKNKTSLFEGRFALLHKFLHDL